MQIESNSHPFSMPFVEALLGLYEQKDLPNHHLDQIRKNRNKLIDLPKLSQNLVLVSLYVHGFMVSHLGNYISDDILHAEKVTL